MRHETTMFIVYILDRRYRGVTKNCCGCSACDANYRTLGARSHNSQVGRYGAVITAVCHICTSFVNFKLYRNTPLLFGVFRYVAYRHYGTESENST